jgi:hypothetical protein
MTTSDWVWGGFWLGVGCVFAVLELLGCFWSACPWRSMSQWVWGEELTHPWVELALFVFLLAAAGLLIGHLVYRGGWPW